MNGDGEILAINLAAKHNDHCSLHFKTRFYNEKLDMELGIKPKRIKFWFQNRRTQAKAQFEKADARVLQLENGKLKRERDELKELNRRVMIETAKSALAEVPAIESSKDSTVVALNARALVAMFMNPSKWQDLFPTIVAKARMIEVLETSMIDDDAGT